MPELLAPCWEKSTCRCRLRLRDPLYFFCHYVFVLVFSCPFTRTGEQKSPFAEPHSGGRHWHNNVLSGAPKGSLVTMPCKPRKDTSHLGFGGPQPCFTPPPDRNEDAKGLDLRGTVKLKWIARNTVTQDKIDLSEYHFASLIEDFSEPFDCCYVN
jgi:hypothetical protein